MQGVQKEFLARAGAVAGGQCTRVKTAINCGEENRPLTCDLLVQIVPGNSEDQYQNCYQHDRTAVVKIQEFPQFVEVMQPRPGIISEVANDPPGQQSIYIPPGDLRKEAYRLSTFESFPKQTPMNVPELAKHGFFYTGFYDRVKCYSCGRTVEHWAAGDNPSDKRWHKQDCLLARGEGSDNIPIGGRLSPNLCGGSSGGASSSSISQPTDVRSRHTQVESNLNRSIPGGVDDTCLTRQGDNRREAYRLLTFESFPKQTTINVTELAKHGFFYTGFYDRVKCYSCGITIEDWSSEDDPADKRWHKHDCLLARGKGNDLSAILSGGSSSGASSSSISQPTDVRSRHTQNFNGPIPGGVDVTCLTRQGGACQMMTNDRIMTRRTSIQTHQAEIRPTTRNPPIQNPLRQWRMANVISADHKRYLTNLYLNRELDRLASFARWPTGRPNVAPVELASAGFFYLGDLDRTQCFSCGGVLRNWTADDEAMEEHRTHFPNCRLVVGVERRNVPIPEQAETPMELAEKYPCRFPMNPHMRSEAARLATFDRRWPADRTRAQPQEVVEAGFFLGERNRVNCWYCNGELQNWEYDDIPWIEHAKWFPNCEFLLAKRGQLFVHRHLSRSPHLPSPTIQGQDGASTDPCIATDQSDPPLSQQAQTCIMRAENVFADNVNLLLPKHGMETLLPLLQMLATKESQTMCEVCRRTPIEVVFIPCGHYVCCNECGQAQRTCRHCNRRVEGVQKVLKV